jgi:hypothetical protein
LGTRFPLHVLAEALRRSLSDGRLSAEAVRQRCLNLTHQPPLLAPVPPGLQIELEPPDLGRYDRLLGVSS